MHDTTNNIIRSNAYASIANTQTHTHTQSLSNSEGEDDTAYVRVRRTGPPWFW